MILIIDSNLNFMQDKDEHLELMEGVLVDLLNAKWNTFVKLRFYRQFFLFCFYFILSLISFTLRPGPKIEDDEDDNDNENNTLSSIITNNIIKNLKLNTTLYYDTINEFTTELTINLTNLLSNKTVSSSDSLISINDFNLTNLFDIKKKLTDTEEWWDDLTDECRLMNLNDPISKIRLIAEISTEFGAILYIIAALREARFLGLNMFIENLVSLN